MKQTAPSPPDTKDPLAYFDTYIKWPDGYEAIGGSTPGAER